MELMLIISPLRRGRLPRQEGKRKRARKAALFLLFEKCTNDPNAKRKLFQRKRLNQAGGTGKVSVSFCQCFVISGEDRVPQFFAGLGIQGMGDIFEFAVVRLAAGHGDEGPVGAFDHFDVMNDKTVIDGDRCDRFQLAVVLADEPNAHV